MSNKNDLVIVRRGDVEALKQEAIFGVFRRDAVEFDKLNALLANAPAIEQGEAVGWKIWWDNRIWLFTDDREDYDNAIKAGMPVLELYTSPISQNEQQPKQIPDGWVSLEDAKPEYIENKDYSQNVIGITKSGYMGIFSLIYIDNGESDSGWAWAKANSVFSDIRKTECEFDDDYEVTHWMPLPPPPTTSLTSETNTEVGE